MVMVCPLLIKCNVIHKPGPEQLPNIAGDLPARVFYGCMSVGKALKGCQQLQGLNAHFCLGDVDTEVYSPIL